MKYVKYQNNEISKLSLGTVQFGMNYGISNKDGKPNLLDVENILKFITKNGINCFDTAMAYGNSEEVLGRTLPERQQQYIISKVSSHLFNKNTFNINDSLNNLKVNHLYGLLLHDSKLLYNWNENISNKVTQLKKNKNIQYFGVSIYTNEDFEMALNNESINIIQIPFNLFDQRAYFNNWFTKAKRKNKLIFIRSIYLQGLLLTDYEDIPKKLVKAKEYIFELDLICKKYKLSRNQLAMGFVNSIAEESILLFGCDNLDQAKENLDILNKIKELDKCILNDIHNKFKNINDSIYNPALW